MIFSTLLVGLLALGHALAGWRNIFASQKKLVQMTLLQKNDTSGAYDIAENSALVSKISSSMIPFRAKPAPEHMELVGLSRMIEFKAYFRAQAVPPQKEPPQMGLRFKHLPDLWFQWGPAPNNNFIYATTINQTKLGMCISYYKVKASPGSVFSISIKVMNTLARDRFSVEWIKTKSGNIMPPQAVALEEAKEPEMFTVDWNFAPPALQLVPSPRGQVLLSQSLDSITISKYANISLDGRYFMLIGYFRPHFKTTRLVLSSTVLIGVGVYAPTLLQGEELPVYRLSSRDGIACKLVVPMDPKLLYRVVVVAPNKPEVFLGFTLMQHDPENEFNSKGVNLLIPAVDQLFQLPPSGSNDVPDLIDLRSRPNSVLEDTLISDFGSEKHDFEFSEGLESPNAGAVPSLDKPDKEIASDLASLKEFEGRIGGHTDPSKSVELNMKITLRNSV